MAKDVRVIANLDIRTCAEGQRSCHLGCLSRNEADVRFHESIYAYCSEH